LEPKGAHLNYIQKAGPKKGGRWGKIRRKEAGRSDLGQRDQQHGGEEREVRLLQASGGGRRGGYCQTEKDKVCRDLKERKERKTQKSTAEDAGEVTKTGTEKRKGTGVQTMERGST